MEFESIITWENTYIVFDLITDGTTVQLVCADKTGEVRDPRIICTFADAPLEAILGLMLTFQAILPTSAHNDHAAQVTEILSILYADEFAGAVAEDDSEAAQS